MKVLITLFISIIFLTPISGCQSFHLSKNKATRTPSTKAQTPPVSTSKRLTERDATESAAIPYAQPLPDSALSETGSLRFQQDDKIKMSIWGHPELDHIGDVQANGMITFPLVGEIKAAQQTPEQLREEIKLKLKNHAVPSADPLRYGDLVHFFVWQHPNLSYSVVVQPDGTINLPLVGQVFVNQSDWQAVNQFVNERLSRYIQNPRSWLIPERQARQSLPEPEVSILPIQLTDRRVTVLGEVGNPGLQSLKSGTRVLDVMASAQIKDTAALSSVVLIRNVNGEAPSYRQLDMAAFMKGDSPKENLVLMDDDVVFIPKTKIAKIGLFIEQFFTRTKPVFDWYLAGAQAARYESIYKLNQEVNEAAKRAFELNTVTPSIP